MLSKYIRYSSDSSHSMKAKREKKTQLIPPSFNSKIDFDLFNFWLSNLIFILVHVQKIFSSFSKRKKGFFIGRKEKCVAIPFASLLQSWQISLKLFPPCLFFLLFVTLFFIINFSSLFFAFGRMKTILLFVREVLRSFQSFSN